jgi:hypothetical protein
MTQAEKDAAAAAALLNTPKTYLDRVVTIDQLREKALNDTRFANSFNGVESLQAGQILSFPTDVLITERTFGAENKPYFSVVTTDGKEIAFSQFSKNDYTGAPINPKFAGLGFEAITKLLSGRTAIVQKVIANMPNFVTVKGQTTRVTELDKLYAPKSVNYFVISGVQEAMIID